MAATIDRNACLNFWSAYSGRADITSMMLNQNAEQLEESDRWDILSQLPDYTDKMVVDLGAGIGRFTGIFAERAAHVVSADFIQSFIEKNKERNSHFSNITFQVSDAVGLKLEDNSTDLLFSNWLLMYLSDSDSVEFLQKALIWLRPGGSLHLRESCTESSTGAKSHNGSMHKESAANPTHYRYSSVYIQLIRDVRMRDSEGKLWRFDLKWSMSVPTYVSRVGNWRQIHWLMTKVAAHDGSGNENPLALIAGMNQTVILQDHIDFALSVKPTWTEKIFSGILAKSSLNNEGTVLAFSARLVSPFVYFDAHSFANQTNQNIWAVETNPFFYRHMITKCNTLGDKRVRYGWNPSLGSALEFWNSKAERFSAFFGTELFLSGIEEMTLKALYEVLVPNGDIFFVEPVRSMDSFESQLKAALGSYFRVESMSDVSVAATSEETQKQAFDSPNRPRWLLVHARRA